MIYEGPPSRHLPGLAALIIAKLKANCRCLYLNRPTMVAGIRSYLAAGGLNVAEEVLKGSLVLSSDQNHLVNGRFDVANMLGLLSDAVDQALGRGYQSLWATGDMSWEFGRERDFSKLLEYEWGLENLFRRQPALTGVCQYHTGTLPQEAVRTGLQAHQAVYINETLTRMNPYFVPVGAMAAATQPPIEEMRKYFEQYV
jgi:hypothetical protein